ncbi:MAG: thioredoxin-disulfide reductase [Nitrospirota bacterium]|nr:thioredoxin-disulfide reductase [Nitrospirota bacterium]
MHNVVIIGSGPAGLTAAIYAARANLRPALIQGAHAGGQLTLTTEVENYPGFRHAILGPDLIKEMWAQAERFGTKFMTGDVSSIDLKTYPLRVTVEGEQTIETKTLIIATGASAIWLGVPGETLFMGHGVSSCATCDGFFFRGQELVVVGGGDTAMEEANFLTRFAGKVSVVHRRDKLRASKIMQDRAFNHEKITFVWNSVVEEILGDSVVTGVRLRNVVTDQLSELKCAGVFVAIGHSPNTGLFEGHVEMDARGYIVTKHGMATNMPGVFAAGDVQDTHYRQAITAAGSGCMAAMDAERYLEALG